jgi:hypothetical protein
MPTPLQDPGSGYLNRAPERDSGASDTSSDTTTAQRGRNFRGDSKSAHREVQWAGSVCVRETSIRSPRGPGRSAKANDAEAHYARGLTGGDGDQCGSAVPRPGRASICRAGFRVAVAVAVQPQPARSDGLWTVVQQRWPGCSTRRRPTGRRRRGLNEDSRCQLRQRPRVKTRVNVCLRRPLLVAFRCNSDLSDLQAVSVSRSWLQLVWPDF